MTGRRSKRRIAVLAAAAVAILALPAASLYYESGGGASCARCHEIRKNYNAWNASSHRKVSCAACHGGLLTLDAGFHFGNLRRLWKHARQGVSEPVRLRNADLPQMMERCRQCHQQEFAQWQAGPHGVNYATIFLDRKHNTQRKLMDDCLRCHGMHFEGGIRDLVTPGDTTGPWRLKDPSLASRPAIPCLACHQVHHEGQPLGKRARETKPAASGQELFRPSLGLYDRRELTHFSAKLLPLPVMREGERPVKISSDPRQALCYQCHAPLAAMQIWSGDDRTPVGVHEGISCLGCHQKHGQQTRASCASCHPRLSNCGLDVEKMDTTFAALGSRRNIHTVKCLDCHPKGVPPKKGTGQSRTAAWKRPLPG